MAKETPERGLLQLRHAGPAQYLDHLGTGELKLLEGSWKLMFDNRGFGALESLESVDDDGLPEQRWAADLLEWCLYEEETASGRKTFACHMTDGTRKYSEDMLDCSRQDIFLNRHFSEGVLQLEATMLGSPRYGSRVWFFLPRILDFMIGTEHDGRWLCTRFRFFRAFLTKLGLDEEELQQSFHSHAAQAAAAQRDIDPSTLATASREFAGTTHGVLAFVLKIGIDGTKLTAPGDRRSWTERCELFLNLLAKAFFPGDPFELECVCNSEVVLSFRVESSEFRLVGGRPAKVVAAVGKLLGTSGTVGSALMRLQSGALRPSRCATSGACDGCAKRLLQCFADCVETSVHRGLWNADVLSMPLLYKMGSSKPRRIALRYKVAISDAVAGEQTLRSPSQFLAVQKIMINKGLALSRGGSRTHALRPKAGRTFSRDAMVAYMMSGRRIMQKFTGGSLCVDATRVSSLELLFVAFWNSNRKRALWTPPQVPRGHTEPKRAIARGIFGMLARYGSHTLDFVPRYASHTSNFFARYGSRTSVFWGANFARHSKKRPLGLLRIFLRPFFFAIANLAPRALPNRCSGSFVPGFVGQGPPSTPRSSRIGGRRPCGSSGRGSWRTTRARTGRLRSGRRRGRWNAWPPTTGCWLSRTVCIAPWGGGSSRPSPRSRTWPTTMTFSPASRCILC